MGRRHGLWTPPTQEASLPFVVVDAITLAIYLAAALLHVRAWQQGEDAPAQARWFGALGVALHAASLGGRLVTGVVPGFSESLSGTSLGVMIVCVWLGRDQLASLGTFLVPAAALLLGGSLLVPDPTVTALSIAHGSWWLPVHLGLVFAATAGFLLEFVVGALQWVVRRRLKRKQLSGLARFPSLDVLDQVRFRALVFGLACLGAGIVVGAGWAASVMHHETWVTDPKVWFTVVVWVWYAVVLQARRTLGWHGRWSMWMSSVGFFGLVFSFVVLEFLAGGFHGYGG